MNVIHLNAAQAAAVSGTSSVNSNAMLIPVALTDATFILGAQVLTDPAHAAKWTTLQAAPVVSYATVSALAPGPSMSAGSATVG